MIYIKNISCLIIIVLAGFAACENDYRTRTINNLVLGDTVSIQVRETSINQVNEISVLMDSVLNDSRCPTDVECIWAGNAAVRFVFKSNNQQTKFILNTALIPRDTTINGYKISLLHLLPYPVSTHPTPYDQYQADIMIQKIRK